MGSNRWAVYRLGRQRRSMRGHLNWENRGFIYFKNVIAFLEPNEVDSWALSEWVQVRGHRTPPASSGSDKISTIL